MGSTSINPRNVTGVLSGFESSTKWQTVFDATLRTTLRKTSDVEDLLRQTADLLGNWVGSEMDSADPWLAPKAPTPPDPWIDPPSDGVFSAAIRDIDPRLLFTAHQSVSAGKPAKVSLKPAAGALGYLGSTRRTRASSPWRTETPCKSR